MCANLLYDTCPLTLLAKYEWISIIVHEWLHSSSLLCVNTGNNVLSCFTPTIMATLPYSLAFAIGMSGVLHSSGIYLPLGCWVSWVALWLLLGLWLLLEFFYGSGLLFPYGVRPGIIYSFDCFKPWPDFPNADPAVWLGGPTCNQTTTHRNTLPTNIKSK